MDVDDQDAYMGDLHLALFSVASWYARRLHFKNQRNVESDWTAFYDMTSSPFSCQAMRTTSEFCGFTSPLGCQLIPPKRLRHLPPPSFIAKRHSRSTELRWKSYATPCGQQVGSSSSAYTEELIVVWLVSRSGARKALEIQATRNNLFPAPRSMHGKQILRQRWRHFFMFVNMRRTFLFLTLRPSS